MSSFPVDVRSPVPPATVPTGYSGAGGGGVSPRSAFALVGLMGAALLVSLPNLVWHRTYPLTSFYSEWLACVCGLAFASCLVLMPRNSEIRLPGMAIGFFMLSLVMSMQLVVMDLVYPERSMFAILYAAWSGMIILAAANFRDRISLERIGRWVQTAFWLAGFLVALSGFVQFFGLDTVFGEIVTMEKGRGMIGVVGQRNYFANVVACGLVSLSYIWARARIGMLPALLTGVPMILALAMTSSRSSIAFLVLFCVVALVFRRSLGPGTGRRLAGGAVVVLMLFLSFQALIAYLPPIGGGESALVTATERLIQSASTSNEYRVRERLYEYAWAIFIKHPILGAGVGEFPWESFQLATRLGDALPGIDRNAHNFALHLLAETGVLGASCVLIPLAVWFVRFPYRAITLDGTWVLMIVLMQLAQGSVELPLWYSNLLALLVLGLGLGAEGGVRLQLHGVRRGVIAALLVSGLVTAGAIFGDYRKIEAWMVQVWRTEKAEGRVLGSQIEELRQFHARSIFSPLMELLAAELMVVEGGDIDAKFELNRRVMHFFPTPGTALREAIYLSMQGRRDESWSAFQAARIVYPAKVPKMMEELATFETRNRGSITWLLDRVAAELKPGLGSDP